MLLLRVGRADPLGEVLGRREGTRANPFVTVLIHLLAIFLTATGISPGGALRQWGSASRSISPHVCIYLGVYPAVYPVTGLLPGHRATAV